MRNVTKKEAGLLFMVGIMVSSSMALWQVQAHVHPSPAKPMASLAERLQDYDRDMGTEPVDARTDRVWHAIPGLAGWKLDAAASEKTTKQATDGRVHLVWHLVPPRVALADLPADPIYRGPNTEKSVALMVNVSWGEAYIPAMLATLRKAHVHATFFLDGKWVVAHPALVLAIKQGGHAIGSHGTGHPDFKRLSNAALTAQLDDTNAVIQRAIGKSVTLIAPPSGSYDRRLVTLSHTRGMYTIMWTADTIDWKRPPADVIVTRVKRGLTPGALILMHPTAPTAQALPQVLQLIASSGYHTKTVADVIAQRPAIHPPMVLSAVPSV